MKLYRRICFTGICRITYLFRVWDYPCPSQTVRHTTIANIIVIVNGFYTSSAARQSVGTPTARLALVPWFYSVFHDFTILNFQMLRLIFIDCCVVLAFKVW